jgi:hypothetical protein
MSPTNWTSPQFEKDFELFFLHRLGRGRLGSRIKISSGPGIGAGSGFHFEFIDVLFLLLLLPRERRDPGIYYSIHHSILDININGNILEMLEDIAVGSFLVFRGTSRPLFSIHFTSVFFFFLVFVFFMSIFEYLTSSTRSQCSVSPIVTFRSNYSCFFFVCVINLCIPLVFLFQSVLKKRLFVKRVIFQFNLFYNFLHCDILHLIVK